MAAISPHNAAPIAAPTIAANNRTPTPLAINKAIAADIIAYISALYFGREKACGAYCRRETDCKIA